MGITQTALTGSGIAGVGRGFTAELWDGFDPGEFLRDPSKGHFYQTSFLAPPRFIGSGALAYNGEYNAYVDNTATSLINGIGSQGGGLKMFNTTINEMTSLQLGTNTSLPFCFSIAPEDDTWPYSHVARLRYETRFAVGSVTASAQSMFIGLSGVLAAADLDNTTGDVVTSKNFFGINTIATTNNTVRMIYQDSSQSAPTVPIAALGTIAINTWYSWGFDYNPLASPSQRISIYWGGTKQSTYITAAQMAAATFPFNSDSQTRALSPSFMVKSIDGSDATLYSSGFRIVQEPLVAVGNEASA